MLNIKDGKSFTTRRLVAPQRQFASSCSPSSARACFQCGSVAAGAAAARVHTTAKQSGPKESSQARLNRKRMLPSSSQPSAPRCFARVNAITHLSISPVLETGAGRVKRGHTGAWVTGSLGRTVERREVQAAAARCSASNICVAMARTMAAAEGFKESGRRFRVGKRFCYRCEQGKLLMLTWWY